MSIYNFNKPNEQHPEVPELKKVDENPNTAQAAANIEKIAQQEGKSDGKDKVVATDGPMGHVYTQALNVALANESVQIVAATAQSASQINQENSNSSMTGEQHEADPSSYVYALGDHIENPEEAMEAFDAVSKAIASGRYKNVYLAVENALSTKMHKRTSSMIEHAMKSGVKVIAKSGSTDSVIQGLSSAIRK